MQTVIKSYKSAWEIFTDPDELKIAEKIQQRRYQMLVHSCIYYKLSDNIISDSQWNEWAHELANLQSQYPNISEKVTLYEYFKEWDGSTGAFLPLNLDWVMQKAKNAINRRDRPILVVKKKPQNKKRKLF